MRQQELTKLRKCLNTYTQALRSGQGGPIG